MMKTGILSYDDKMNKWVVSLNNRIIVKGNSRSYVEDAILKGQNKKAKKLGITNFVYQNLSFGAMPDEEVEVSSIIEEEEFSITERFGFVEEMTQMIIDGSIPSAILTGPGGLGKSFTVMSSLTKSGLKDIRQIKQPEAEEDSNELPLVLGDYIVVKGFSTAKGLYRTLYENSTKIIIFDDCDNIQKDANAVNLLKAALDSYDTRIISWNSEMRNSDLPQSFLFTGRVIFISNLASYQIEQPLRSRSICIDLSMTSEQKIERMRTIIDSDEFLPEISYEFKEEALAFIDEHKEQTNDLSLRSLISISKIRAGDKSNWQKLAKYVLTTN
jgi:hypothetical protein